MTEEKFVRSLPALGIGRKDAAMKRTRKAIPQFTTEAEERAFWDTHDSTEYVDWSTAQRMRLPHLKPSTQAISPYTLRVTNVRGSFST